MIGSFCRDGRAMKTNFKSCIAAAVSAVIAFCSMSTYIVSGADSSTEQQTYTLSYNLDFEGIEIEDETVFESVEVAAGKNVIIPYSDIELGDTYVSGWTVDNVYMYESDDYFKMPAHDVVLQPVWVNFVHNDVTYEVSYNTDGDDYNLLNNTFPSGSYRPGDPVTVNAKSILRDGYTQIGWTFEGNRFTIADKMIMPDHDVVFEPCWYKHYDQYYEAGDVDRINGSKMFIYSRYETNSFNLADSSKFSRSGFTLSGWLCDLDGQVYKTDALYSMPSSDVHFTAVWTPKNYTVVFKSGTGSSNTIKISGLTDTAITVPECPYSKTGYVFGGWKYKDEVYQPGDEFIIPGALPGLGISLDAVWVEPSEEKDYDSFTLAEARKKYTNGEITAEELQQIADFLVGR